VPPVQVYRRKIRFSDTDAQSIVFNANYLRYVDDAITDYFDELEVPWSTMQAKGYDLVLGRVELDFRSSAKIGDTVVVSIEVVRVGTTSVVFEATLADDATGSVFAECREIQVMVDAETFEKKPVPDWFIERVEALQEAPLIRSAAS
jgi:acyl-CoA thioester hydrolase